jgi:3-oxoacyl-[acyl-carrier protein] reductase
MDLGLAGRGVLVTGGAGGIGAAIVRAFAAEGASVAVHHHTSGTAAAALATEIGGLAAGADLRDERAVDRLFAEVLGGLGRLDVCVANAGRWPADDTPIWDLSLERWEETLRVNLTASFLTTRAFLRHAAETGAGSLVLVSSTAAVFGEAGHADYASAKAGLLGLLATVKNEAARIGDGVRVNAVAPGWTVTPQREQAGIDPAHVARATATMPMKKLGRPEDVAAQVVVLASDVASGHVTGELVTVAGGMEGRLVP